MSFRIESEKIGWILGKTEGVLFFRGFNYNSQNIIWINNGDMTFSKTTIPYDYGSDVDGKFFDYDNDGDLDIFVARRAGDDRVLINNNMNFTIEYIHDDSTVSSKIDIADVDGDGFKDVLIGKWRSQDNVSLKMLLNNSGNGFSENNISENDVSDLDDETNSVRIGDLDNDGYMDFVTGNGSYESQKNYILFQ